jgi:hypothetical protein
MIEEPGSAGSWSQFDATGELVSPMSRQPILPPPAGAGNLYFVKDQTGPSAGVLYIPLAVPAGDGPISLSFDYFVQTNPELAIGDTMSAAGSLTAWANQQFRVDIVSSIPADWFAAPGEPLVSVVAPTKGSSNPATAWTSVDVAGLATSLAGSRGNTVYLAFREVDNQSYLTVGVDNVRFAAETVVQVLCDNPTTPAQVFACAISVNPATVSAASVAVGDAPPGMFQGLAPLGEPIISQPDAPSGYGWSLFGSPAATTPSGSTVPDPIDGSYHLFETGEAGVTAGVEGTLSIPFTIPADATETYLSFAYFLQSRWTPESGSTPDLAAGQEFTLSYTSDTPGYPGSGLLFSASGATGFDGNPWGWQSFDFFDVADLSVANVERDYTLVFSAKGAASTMQVGVDLLQVYTNGRDLTKKTFGVHTEELLAFPVHGADYGVMSTGDAATVTAADSQQTFLSAQFGGTTYTEGATVRDLTRISMDLVPPGGSRCVSLDIRFLSEEFPEYVGSSFNDIFLAELRQNSVGTPWSVANDYVVTAPDNFAVVPVPPAPDEVVGTTTVLSINTTNDGWFSAEATAGTAFDGGSILLRATKEIDVSTTSVELILSLFDQSDESFDTAVMLDALQFWPTVDCSASSEDPTASIGIQVVAPAAEWSAVTDAEVFVDELPTLTLMFDQPVSDLLDSEILNVGDASDCLFDVTPQNASDGSATEFTVAVTSCGVGSLQPQLQPEAVQGLADNSGPEFQVTSFPIMILALGGGGGGGGGGGTPTPTPSASSTPSASPSASIKPSPSASVKPTTTPSSSASPGASGGVSPSAAPSVKPSPTPSGSSSQSGGGGTSGGGDGGGWTLPTLPTLDQLANNFWFGVLLGAIVVLALWGLTNGLQRRVDSAPDEA